MESLHLDPGTFAAPEIVCATSNPWYYPSSKFGHNSPRFRGHPTPFSNPGTFTVASPQPTDNVPLRPPGRKKGKKRKNKYTGPPPATAPGAGIRFDPVSNDLSGVSFHPETLRLPILPDGPDVNLSDRGFPNRQRDYDFLVEESEGVDKEEQHSW